MAKQPYFNPKFKQWEISWNKPDGSCGAVWGDTKEKCLERYSKLQTKC